MSVGKDGKPLGIVLVDPLHTVRAGMALLIERDARLEVVTEAGEAGEALARLDTLARQRGVVVVVGLGLPGPEDAFWLIRQLRQTKPSLTLLACGANSDANAVSRALFVGADGFVDKNAAPTEFLDGLVAAAGGEVVVVGPAEGMIGAIAAGIERQRDSQGVLTDREREILTIAAEGLTAKRIAERLGLSERTVTTHLARIYNKLGVNSRVAAVTAAAQKGLVVVPDRGA